MSQQSILIQSKKFLKDAYIKKHKSNIAYNPNYFLTSWADTIGYINLKKFFKKKITISKKIKIILKEFISIHKDILKINEFSNLDNYDNLIMSYFFEKNLKKDGSYYDKYFSINTKSLKKTLWILIPITKNNNNFKTNPNVIILKRKNFNFFKVLLVSTYSFTKNLFKSYFYTKNENINFKNTKFSKTLANIILDLVTEKSINNFIFPYEAQPHQHYLVNKLKEKKKIRVIGYMHTVIPPLPLDYLKREGHPDLLLVNGTEQKKILCQKLGWEKNEVKTIVSLRYKKNSPFNFNKNIFLPYFLENEKKMFNNFKKLIFMKKPGFFPKLRVRNHPSMYNSKHHLSLIKKLDEFIKIHKNYFKNSKENNNMCIFFGSSASVAEGLERGCKVFHICSDPELEKFDKFYWSVIKTMKQSSNIFEYKIKNRSQIIRFNTLKENKFIPIY